MFYRRKSCRFGMTREMTEFSTNIILLWKEGFGRVVYLFVCFFLSLDNCGESSKVTSSWTWQKEIPCSFRPHRWQLLFHTCPQHYTLPRQKRIIHLDLNRQMLRSQWLDHYCRDIMFLACYTVCLATVLVCRFSFFKQQCERHIMPIFQDDNDKWKNGWKHEEPFSHMN